MGFAVPLALWLRKRLKNWMFEILSEDKLKRQKIFHFEFVKKLMDEHISQKKNNQYGLWNILMFQIWYDKWME